MNKTDYLNLGVQLLNDGDVHSAKEVFVECAKLDLDDINSIILLAEAELAIGNSHKALYLLKESQKIREVEEVSTRIDEIKRHISDNEIKEKLITVAFIVKNEEKTLPNAIKSVSRIADEIIVVDTGSTDRTIEKAEALGAKIFHFDWCNDYSAARNTSIKYSTSKWILYLDADEELAKESSTIIRELAQKSEKNTGALLCEIKSSYFDLDNSTLMYTGKYPRFFRNIGYPVLHFFGKVHEQISTSLLERNYQMLESPLIIEHHGYAISQQEMSDKLKRHLKTLREHVEQEPYNGYSWYHLGNTLFQMKQYSECREILENAIKCDNLSKLLSANTSILISRVYEELKDMKSAMDWAHKALSYIENYEFALKRKAEILDKVGLLGKFIR